MKTLIWDLDGTLLNSYPLIVESLLNTYAEYGVVLKEKEVYSYIIHYSAVALIEKIQRETGLDSETILKRYREISKEKVLEIQTFPEAKITLDTLASQGAVNYVFTHRGVTTEAVLKHLRLWDCFEEVLTSQSPFPRKPAPDALLYLMEKYRLSKQDTFYVGDRTIDMDCAKNADIRGILFKPETSYCEPNGSESIIVKNLMDIPFLKVINP